MPAIAVRSSTTPPCTGTLAPHTPLRPPAAVTGTRASLQTDEHGGHLAGVGRAADARRPAPGTWPSSAQIIASGHQSRLASARSA